MLEFSRFVHWSLLTVVELYLMLNIVVELYIKPNSGVELYLKHYTVVELSVTMTDLLKTTRHKKLKIHSWDSFKVFVLKYLFSYMGRSLLWNFSGKTRKNNPFGAFKGFCISKTDHIHYISWYLFLTYSIVRHLWSCTLVLTYLSRYVPAAVIPLVTFKY